MSAASVETENKLAAYLSKQERNGVPFDVDKATAFQAKLSARRQELAEILQAEFGSFFVRGKTFTPKRDNKKMGYVAGAPCTKIKLLQFNPASQDHIANRLTHLYDWKPQSFTKTGKPQVDEGALKGMTFPIIEPLREYLLVNKRLEQLAEGKQAWLKLISDARSTVG